MGKDIWITGVGAVSSIGIGRDGLWEAAVAGRSGAILLEHPILETDQLSTRIGAPVRGFDPVAHHIPAKDLPILDITAQYALAAAYDAILDAGFQIDVVNARKGLQGIQGVVPERCGVVIGTVIGGVASMVDSLVTWHDSRRKAACKRYSLPMVIPNAPAAQVAMRFQARAECKGVVTACAAGTMAIGDAYRLLRDDEADLVVCGGVEGMLSDPELYAMVGFDLLKTMSRRNDDPKHASRPFDRQRDGFVLSEGAGILVLEREDHARARGARPYARIASYAASCDAASILQIDAEGREIERMIRTAVARAGLSLESIDYVNAHGTSTVLNDRVEAQVLQRVFDSSLDRLAVSATKSMTGHAVAASGAIEAILTALTLDRGIIPPTINFHEPDPECRLHLVPNHAEIRAVQTAITNSFGFGGHNACLVLTRV